MAKRDTNETKELKTWPNLVQLAYLDRLKNKGLYGNSRADVVLRLVDDRLKEMLKSGELNEEAPPS